MFTIKVDDGFCEWTYTLEGSGEYSIADLLECITENTKLHIYKRYLSKTLEDKIRDGTNVDVNEE